MDEFMRQDILRINAFYNKVFKNLIFILRVNPTSKKNREIKSSIRYLNKVFYIYRKN